MHGGGRVQSNVPGTTVNKVKHESLLVVFTLICWFCKKRKIMILYLLQNLQRLKLLAGILKYLQQLFTNLLMGIYLGALKQGPCTYTDI